MTKRVNEEKRRRFSEKDFSLTTYGQGSRHNPNSFKMGRRWEIQRPNVERFLIADLSDKPNDEGMVSLKNMGKNLSKLTIQSINFTLGKYLYNASYQCGNTEENTGLAKGGVLSDGALTPKFVVNGKSYYYGEIQIKLSEFAADVFGKDEADNRQKREVLNTLTAMQNSYLEDTEELKGTQLLNIRSYQIDKTTGAKILNIVLHPIFAMDVARNFGAHPQDILKRLSGRGKRITEAKMELLRLLGIQDKKKPFKIYASVLLDKLGLTKTMKKDKTRTKKQLQATFDAMVECKIITQRPTERKGTDGDIQYCFTLNPEYVKEEEIMCEDAQFEEVE